jgi:YHS domain-containing protein
VVHDHSSQKDNENMKTYLTALMITFLGFAAASAAEEAPAKPYPLKTCVVSNELLDSMGKPYVFAHEGQEVKLCCKQCKKDFDKEPAKYIKKIDEAKPGSTPSAGTGAATGGHQH